MKNIKILVFFELKFYFYDVVSKHLDHATFWYRRAIYLLIPNLTDMPESVSNKPLGILVNLFQADPFIYHGSIFAKNLLLQKKLEIDISGVCRFNGLLVQEENLTILPKSCLVGEFEFSGICLSALWELGTIYIRSFDKELGFKFIEVAASAGHLPSMEFIGTELVIENSENFCFTKGIEFLSRASSLGSQNSFEKLCEILSTNVAKQYILAVDGDNECQYIIGLRYYLGAGLPLDYSYSFFFFHQSALQGNIVAMNNLAVCFENGRGVPVDISSAIKWFTKSAELGNSMAAKNLGVIYEKDNLELSIFWHEKAVFDRNFVSV